MRNKKGQFKKGERASPKTEFKPGQHWRKPKLYWVRDWLYQEYVVNERSAADIASEFDCNENNILYFLAKHNIPRRSMSEVRRIKHWGLYGEENGNWQGGCEADRRAFYSSQEWARAVQIIWKRDKATCQRCHKTEYTNEGLFHVHHIAPFTANKALRGEIENLVLLCDQCHRFIHSRENTEGEFLSD